MKILTRRGQSTGEYAILFAIVLGAIVAMQNYVRNRIAGSVRAGADNYMTQVSASLPGAAAFAPNRTSDSSSDSSAKMATAESGTIGAGSLAHSVTNN